MHASTPRAAAIMIIRHGEKPPEPPALPPPFGVTADGEQDDHSLSVRGWQRAGALVALFAPPPRQAPVPSIRTPNVIYAFKTDSANDHPHDATGAPIGSKGKRAQQTVTPLADKLGALVTLNFTFDKGDEIAMITSAMACHGSVLICWEHHSIPLIAQQLPVNQATPVPPTWPADPHGVGRFDVVWVFAYDQAAGTYQFSQVAQDLLAGDLPL